MKITETDLPDQWQILKEKFTRQSATLEAINSRLEAMKMKIEFHEAEMAYRGFNEESDSDLESDELVEM